MRSQNLFWALLLITLAGCQSTGRLGDGGPTPAQVIASGDASSTVHWGGRVVGIENLPDRTLVEVLALPLDRSGRPRWDQDPLGRFIIEKRGFLEPLEYAPGRLVAVHGKLNGFTSGQVGEAAYRYPVVIGERLLLWPQGDSERASRVAPRINFGIGAGSYGGGVGVGIGF
jgi:outer membrane lipoprotein